MPRSRGARPGILARTVLLSVLVIASPAGVGAQEARWLVDGAWTDRVWVDAAPAMPEDFDHLPYVNPDAPRSCTRRQVRRGTFDNLNPFILAGRLEMGAYDYLYDPLMAPSEDELQVAYGLVAEAASWDAQARILRFRIDPEARWHDGAPVTAGDVVFTLQALAEYGRPFYRRLLFDAAFSVESDAIVRIDLPEDVHPARLYQIATLPVMPRHYWSERDFEAITVDPPLGGGAFRIAEVDPGHRIVYERVGDYWAADHPMRRGFDNFDRLEVVYVRDEITQFEMFLTGQSDTFQDFDAGRWATGYDVAAVENGDIRRIEVPNWYVIGMNGFFFNLDRPGFDDRRIRRALALAVDWTWANEVLFHGSYERTDSFFENAPMEAVGAPTPAERALLEPLVGTLIPEAALTERWSPANGDGSGRGRSALGEAMALFAEAGWQIVDGTLIDGDGVPVTLSIVSNMPRQERFLDHVIANWRRMGIDVAYQILDTASYTARVREGSFDLAYRFIIPAMRPDASLRDLWGSAAIATEGEPNPYGIGDPLTDALIERVLAAPDEEERMTAARALDRALQWQEFVIPSYHDPVTRMAYWDRFVMPDRRPAYGWGFDTWWCVDAAGPV